ncbi:MAG: hypothetical protein KAI72_02545 [Candidatus Pacebacteria bacterium]|nr:hypothetical protein [Candidatus Paceibacterota bacterium]
MKEKSPLQCINCILIILCLFAFTSKVYSEDFTSSAQQSFLSPHLNISLDIQQCFSKSRYLFKKYNTIEMQQLLMEWAKSCKVKLQLDNPWKGKIVPFEGHEEFKLEDYVFRGMILNRQELATILNDGIRVSDYNDGYFWVSDIPWGGFFFSLKPFFEMDIFYKNKRPTENYYSVAFQISTKNITKYFKRGKIFEDVPADNMRIFLFNQTTLTFEEMHLNSLVKTFQLESNTIQQAI